MLIEFPSVGRRLAVESFLVCLMFKQLLGLIWRKLPKWTRHALVVTTQTSFTVSAGVIVVNAERQVLLLNHVLRPKSGWGIPGGFLKANEQPAEAARREIFEETNLKISDVQLIEARTIKRHVEFIFSAATNDQALKLSREIFDARWFALYEIPAEINRQDRRLIERALSEIGEKRGLGYSVGK